MSSIILRSADLFGIKPVVMVLFMLCSALFGECLRLKPCCVEICEYGCVASGLDFTQHPPPLG